MTSADPKTAFVLAGGGSLGAIQVGMLHALMQTGLRPDFVIGSSVGAINAAYFAGSPDIAGVARLASIWSDLRRADVFPFTLSGAVGLLRHPDNIVDSSRLRNLIEANLAYAKLEDALIPLHVMATDQQGSGVRLSTGPAAEAIMASSAVPGIFPPVKIGAHHLMDGAIAANTPLRLAVELGATRIIVLPTGYACALKEPPKGVIAKALHAVTLLIAWQLMHEIEVIPQGIQVHMAPALCPLAISPYDFSASRQLIDRAMHSTRKWIEGGGLTRQARPWELGAHHH